MDKIAFNDPVPYMVFDGEMARQERTIKRLWILVIILIALFVGTNGAWIYYESLYTDVTYSAQTISQDGGSNTFTGDFYGGDFNGETSGDTGSN